MPRKARDYFLSDYMHVMVQGDEKKFIFHSDEQKKFYEELMLKKASENGVSVVAYCVMGNHVHLLLYSRDVENVSKMMQMVNSSYAMKYNQKKKVVGHVFRDRFRSENIYSKRYLICCIKYIHNNPVKANMCKAPGDYPFSSYQIYQYNKKSILKNIKDIDEEDWDELMRVETVDLEFMDEEIFENFEEVCRVVKKKYDLSNLSHNDIVKIYQEIKVRCKISNEEIAKFLDMHVSKLRRILKKYKDSMK